MDNSHSPVPPIKWDIVITSKRNWFSLQLSELWRYRDMIMLFVRRDFVSTYKQTILGPLWFIIQPLMSSVMYAIVFGQIAKIPTDGLPPFLFYFGGIVIWGFFSSCLVKCSSVFTSNAGMFSKVYFPRLAVPVATVMSGGLSFIFQFATFLFFLAFFAFRGNTIEPNIGILCVPILILNATMLAVGIGCLVSALTTRYRDLQMALGFGMQLWMYGSCIFYSKSAVPENLRWAINLNPMATIVENFRSAFLGNNPVNYPEIGINFIVSSVILFIGIVIFHQVEKDFADNV